MLTMSKKIEQKLAEYRSSRNKEGCSTEDIAPKLAANLCPERRIDSSANQEQNQQTQELPDSSIFGKFRAGCDRILDFLNHLTFPVKMSAWLMLWGITILQNFGSVFLLVCVFLLVEHSRQSMGGGHILGHASSQEFTNEPTVIGRFQHLLFKTREFISQQPWILSVTGQLIIWLMLWAFFIKLEVGSIYFIVSVSYIMYRSMQTGRTDYTRLSAYSVFNRNCERIGGTFTGEDFDRQLRTGGGLL